MSSSNYAKHAQQMLIIALVRADLLLDPVSHLQGFSWTGEANCTGHIHPPLKANMKPQSQQLTAGMEVSFRTPVLVNWLREKKQFG